MSSAKKKNRTRMIRMVRIFTNNNYFAQTTINSQLSTVNYQLKELMITVTCFVFYDSVFFRYGNEQLQPSGNRILA